MTTNNNLTAAGQSVSAKLRRNLWRFGGAASVAALALGLIGSYAARGQLSGVQINGLAEGSSVGNAPYNLHVNGSSDVLQAELVFQPGGQTGWHYHPGPVVVVIKSGTLTETQSDGCVILHPAGSVFFEMPNEVHNAYNTQSNEVTDVYATFLSPSGAAPLIPVAPPDNPGGGCRGNNK